MKKIKLFAVLGFIICAFSVMAVACSRFDLEAPTGLHIDENYRLTWSTVKEAKNYLLEVTNVDSGESDTQKIGRTYYSLAKLDEGDYDVRIKAIGSTSNGEESDWSKTLSFTKEYETGCIYTLINNGSAYELTRAGGSATSGDLVLEDTYRGKPVVSIGSTAFAGRSRLTSVQIGAYVTEIGKSAFNNCSGLTSVTFPENLISLGEAAFQSCMSLKEITLPDSLKTIENGAFNYCRQLERVNLGNGVISIGDSAFARCTSLQSVKIPDSVQTIGQFAFDGATSLQTVEFGSGLTAVSYAAFQLCTSLSELKFSEDNHITYIDEYAFLDCDSLVSVTLPEGVTDIAYRAFSNMGMLTTVSLPDSITHISKEAFVNSKFYADSIAAGDVLIYADDWIIACNSTIKSQLTNIQGNKLINNCNTILGDSDDIVLATIKDDTYGIADSVFREYKSLTTLQMPDSVKIYGRYSFAYCNLLRRVTSNPNSVEIIDSSAFAYCTGLTSISFAEGLKNIGTYAFMGCSNLNNRSTEDGTLDDQFFPKTLTNIGAYAFKDSGLWGNPDSYGVIYAGTWIVGYDENTILSSVVLNPETVGIAEYAFLECETVTNVDNLYKVKYIGRGAFYECTNLAQVSFNDNLKEIRDYTFYKCSSLRSVDMPAMLQSIGRSAFYKCSTLNGIDLSGSEVVSIDEYAFYGCSNLKTLNLGKYIKEINNCTFYNCTSLGEVYIPDSVQNIGSKAFSKCTNLEKLTIGSGVKSIGEYAFNGCMSLKSITIPDSVEVVSKSAFYKCVGVEELILGSGLKTVGDYAFYGLESLKQLYIPKNIESLGRYSFKGCNALTSVVVSNDLQIGAHTFYGCKNMTIYTDAESLSESWSTLWNTSYRPVVWGCELSDDNSYVISVTVTETTLTNATKVVAIITEETDENGEPIIESKIVNQLTAPVREGYVFAGWATENGGEVVYSATELLDVPTGITLYAVWEQAVEQPEQQN